MDTVIAGAKYYDRDRDVILIPHYTGEYSMVDCTEYATKEDLKGRYDKDFIKNNEENYIEHNGEIYYYAEWGPFSIGGWELLSDISDLLLIN